VQRERIAIRLDQPHVNLVKQEPTPDMMSVLLDANLVLQCTSLLMMVLKNVDIVLLELLIMFLEPLFVIVALNLLLVIALVEDKIYHN